MLYMDRKKILQTEDHIRYLKGLNGLNSLTREERRNNFLNIARDVDYISKELLMEEQRLSRKLYIYKKLCIYRIGVPILNTFGNITTD